MSGLENWRRSRLASAGVDTLFYVSLIDNLTSILASGILPKNRTPSSHRSFAEESVQERRHQKIVELSDRSRVSVHDCVPLYLTPRTPTLYARRELQSSMFFIDVSSEAVCNQSSQFAFSDGNAGANATQFYRNLNDLDKIPFDVVRANYWTDFSDGSRKRCSEFLVSPSVPPDFFQRIVVAGRGGLDRCVSAVQGRIPVVVEPAYFFV